ncbi:tyrosine-protein phosphatase non-receptor type substrate 1-like [Huso huso]|uniref:Tyrosine-protein phosphatase non-receptor type substrate 1-like n=1 Tax=Huso huso TaxID=61971 RepID=A0ABR0Y5R7_HUSHU
MRTAVLGLLCVTGLLANELQISQPSHLTVLKGDSVSMNCSFNYTGDDRVYGKWYKRQPEGEKHYLDKSSTACVLLHPALLDNVSECVVTTHIPNISFNHSGVYNCEVKIPSSIQSIDSEGEGTRLEVYAPPSFVSIYQSANEVVAGAEFTLRCVARGFYPASVGIEWFHKGALVSSGDKPDHLEKHKDGSFSAYRYLRLFPKAKDQAMVFTCNVTHIALQTPISRDVHLSVKYPPLNQMVYHRLSPSDGFQPLVGRSLYCPPGSYLELQCVVESEPASQVVWFNTSNAILGNGTNSTATMKGRASDGGVYWCRASNAYGTTQQEVRVNPESSFPVRMVTYPLFVIIVSALLLYRKYSEGKAS